MPSLHELQQLFVDGILHDAPEILSQIKTGHLSTQQQLAIYQNSIMGVLQKTLQDIYPVCRKLVGDEFFLFLANTFIRQTPSNAPDLAAYGKTFADCIKILPQTHTLPYLPDVAQLEWAWHHAFRAAPLAPTWLTADAINQGDHIVFLLPAHSTLLQSSFPIHTIWAVNQADYPEDPVVTLTPGQQYYYLVWKKNLEMRIDCLNCNQYRVLNWVYHALTLGEMCERIENEFTDIDIVALLPELIQQGWVPGMEEMHETL